MTTLADLHAELRIAIDEGAEVDLIQARIRAAEPDGRIRTASSTRRDDDVIGGIAVYFYNASSAQGCKRRVCPDIHAARALVAHYRPFNNTDIDAWLVVATDGTITRTEPVDLRSRGAYRFCPCGADEPADCTR